MAAVGASSPHALQQHHDGVSPGSHLVTTTGSPGAGQLHQLQNDHGDHAEPPLNPLVAILLIYGVIFLMIMAQAGLVLWRKRHAKSYDLVTLVGLWLMPAMFSLQLHFWRFLVIWAIYSVITLYLLSLCMHKKMDHATPRLVYSWFLGAHRVSVIVGMAGYIMLLMEFMGLGPLFNLLLPRGTSITLLWYGLYLGVLGRDCAEVASDRMAAGLGGGGGRRLMNTANACGICGAEMHDYSHLGEDKAPDVEPSVQLSCKHSFHNLCIRGWTMVGKKDTCPVCCEKVDLRALYADRPWDTKNLTWLQMLDMIRYMVVWQPTFLMVLSLMIRLGHLGGHAHPHASPGHLHALSPHVLPGMSPHLSSPHLGLPGGSPHPAVNAQ